MSSKKKPAAKAAPKKSETPKYEVEIVTPIIPSELDLAYWRSVVKTVLPDESDQWEIGKYAVALEMQIGLLKKHHADLKRIAKRNDDKINLPWSWKIDSSAMPPHIKVNSVANDKLVMRGESDVPDENEIELPGLQIMPDNKPTDNEPARVRSADEKE